MRLTKRRRLNGREQLNQQRAAAKYVSSYSNTSLGSRERKSKIHFNAVRAHRDSQIATADEIEVRSVTGRSLR